MIALKISRPTQRLVARRSGVPEARDELAARWVGRAGFEQCQLGHAILVDFQEGYGLDSKIE
jgi:hypothetical protein